jgi:glutamine synthetase
MRHIDSLLGDSEFVAIATPDNCGRLIGKRRPVADWPLLLAKGMAMPDFHLVTGLENRPHPDMPVTGEATGFRNGRLFPDPTAAFLSPAEPRTAYVLAEARHADGKVCAEAPRQILAAQLARLAAMGVSAKAASELEFYAFRTSFSALRDNDYAGAPLYHRSGDNDLLVSGHGAAFYGAIVAALTASGIVVDQMQGEAGPGQCEINIAPAPLAKAADTHAAFKHIVKATAHGLDHAVTFLAKPFATEASSGGHMHLSFTQASGANALADADGLTVFGATFLAGIVAFTPELTVLSAPYQNSYRRLQPGSFAPLRANWGYEARTVMLRLLGEGDELRMEFRLPGADANPYLAYAAVIAAGLHGVETRATLPSEGEGPPLPGDLTEAVLAFEGSAMADEVFGSAVKHHLAKLARHELAASRRAVSPWEIRRGFEEA